MERRVGGVLFFKVNSELFQIKTEVTYNIKKFERVSVVGQDGVHGYKEVPKILFCEGAITDNSELDLEAFHNLVDATVTLELANGKVIVFKDAFEAGSGDSNSSEGEVNFRFEALDAEEIRA